MKPRALLLSGLVLAVAAPAATAATKPVYMGPPPSASKKFEARFGDANAFFPSTITVRAGDSVRFVPVGFHTVDLPAKGGGAQVLIMPNGQQATGVNDAAGQPFWFDGKVENVGFNPALLAGLFGKTATYDGSKRVSSGLPLADKPKPVTVKFTKAGTYTYYCDVHPGMKGTVKVVGRSAKPPSAKADAKVVAKELARDLKTLDRVNAYKPGAAVIQIGGAGKNGVESYRFFPAAPSVSLGTTVTFQMPVGSTEVHTASTGPGDPEKEPKSYLGEIAASFNAPVIDPRAVYSSEAPGSTPASLTPTLHGNGFWSSGVLDRDENSPQPATNQVTFGQAGTYTFYCLIHPFMKAVVTVT